MLTLKVTDKSHMNDEYTYDSIYLEFDTKEEALSYLGKHGFEREAIYHPSVAAMVPDVFWSSDKKLEVVIF